MRHLCCLWQQFRQNLALARHADEDVSAGITSLFRSTFSTVRRADQPGTKFFAAFTHFDLAPLTHQLVHFPDFPLTSFRRRTPGPPPFSSMNSTPAEKFTEARSIPQFREGAQPQVSVRNWQAARFAFVRR
jgi:hypothetical protein